MRNMSFALTKTQIIEQTKTVTRRMGWLNLRVGDLVQPVEKCMGFKKGETVKKIGGPIRIKSVRREPLMSITDEECVLEGFPEMSPHEFTGMFMMANNCPHDVAVTRIEFEYVDPRQREVTKEREDV